MFVENFLTWVLVILIGLIVFGEYIAWLVFGIVLLIGMGLIKLFGGESEDPENENEC
jgi:hypothetical protein